MRESMVELVLAKHIEDARKDTGGASMTILRIEVQHLGSRDGQRDTYTPTLQGDLFQVRTESGTGRLIVIDGMTQIVYAKGAWSRVKIEYSEQGGYRDSKDWNQHPPVRETSITAVADAKAMLQKTVKATDEADDKVEAAIEECRQAATADEEDADMVAALATARGLAVRLGDAFDKVEELKEAAKEAGALPDEDDGDVVRVPKGGDNMADKANAAHAEKNKKAAEADADMVVLPKSGEGEKVESVGWGICACCDRESEVLYKDSKSDRVRFICGECFDGVEPSAQ